MRHSFRRRRSSLDRDLNSARAAGADNDAVDQLRAAMAALRPSRIGRVGRRIGRAVVALWRFLDDAAS